MTLLDTPMTDVRATFGHEDYLALNAELTQFAFDTDGNKIIQFDKDKEAANAYFLNHVNPNTVYFDGGLREKLDFLMENNYYEREYIEKYDFEFVKKLYKQVYDHKYRFPSFMGAYKYYTSYALKTFDGSRYLERFEDRVASVALYLADGDKKQAERLAEEIITGRFQPATPTFMNSGKKQRGELVSCFLLSMEDDLNSIFRAVNSAAQLSKRGGGVAVALTNLRGAGDPIKQIQNQSSGIMPVLKILEDTGKYVDQLGQRQGAFAAYLSAFHIDIKTFLDSKRENADEASRIKTLSLGVMVPDILFELARKGDEMYTFSPYDVEKAYGKQFAFIDVSKEYHRMVDNPRIRKEKIQGGARGFLTMLAETQLESGYPYLIFQDSATTGNPNAGHIIMSNLCTEIFQTTEPSVLRDDQTYEVLGKDISCNLGSINMLSMLHSPNFGASIETMIRALSQVSDFSDIEAVPTVANGNRKSHAIGLGVMNVASTLGHYEMHYGERESLDLVNAYYQLVTFHALRASNAIARERKQAYDRFEESTYASGAYFEKFVGEEFQHLYTVKTEKVRGILAENNLVLPTREDWIELAAKVKRHGLYNAYLQAVAPTGSISYITNCSPSAMPITSRLETRKEGRLGTVSYPAPLMTMHNIEYFKTAFEIPVEWSIDLYSVMMWYIDQSASLTLHFPAGSGPRDVTKAQMYAFSKGKPSSKEPSERQQMLNEFPSGAIKSLYYYRIAASVLDELKSDSVASASYDECVACAL